MQPRPLRRSVPPLATPHSLLLCHHRRMQPQPLARQPRAALSTLCLPRERSPLEALRRKMREAWRTHDLERSLPASSMLCGGAVASHCPSQSSPVGRLAAQLQFKNKQKRRTGAHPLPITRTKGDEAFYRPRGRQHGVPLRVHGSPLQVLQLYSFNFTTVVYWIPTVDRVLISYGFNSYRLRVNKLELELEHFV